MIFCNYEGQIDQKSDFETRQRLSSILSLLINTDNPKSSRSKSFIRLYVHLRSQIISAMKDSTSDQLCIAWMYLRSWGPSACHSLIDKMTGSITEDDYNSALLNIMKGPNEHSSAGKGPKEIRVCASCL